MHITRRLVLVVGMAAALPSFAQSKVDPVNKDLSGVAIKGYDPVAYFTHNKPVIGNPKIKSSFEGAEYFFASVEHRALFDANPAKYEPQFGGFCAYAASQNHTAPVKIEAFQIVNGRLLMQYDLDVRKEFNKDTQGNLQKADKNWPGLVQKEGK